MIEVSNQRDLKSVISNLDSYNLGGSVLEVIELKHYSPQVGRDLKILKHALFSMASLPSENYWSDKMKIYIAMAAASVMGEQIDKDDEKLYKYFKICSEIIDKEKERLTDCFSYDGNNFEISPVEIHYFKKLVKKYDG